MAPVQLQKLLNFFPSIFLRFFIAFVWQPLLCFVQRRHLDVQFSNYGFEEEEEQLEWLGKEINRLIQCPTQKSVFALQIGAPQGGICSGLSERD